MTIERQGSDEQQNIPQAAELPSDIGEKTRLGIAFQLMQGAEFEHALARFPDLRDQAARSYAAAVAAFERGDLPAAATHADELNAAWNEGVRRKPTVEQSIEMLRQQPSALHREDLRTLDFQMSNRCAHMANIHLGKPEEAKLRLLLVQMLEIDRILLDALKQFDRRTDGDWRTKERAILEQTALRKAKLYEEAITIAGPYDIAKVFTSIRPK